MSEVSIVASAFGVDAIRRDGHLPWAQAAAHAGAAAFEVRRELMSDEAAAPDALRALGNAIRALGVWIVWSTPATLYTSAGALDEHALRHALIEARACGARFVKLQLGGFTGDADGQRIAACLASAGERADGDAAVRLVVENGQMKEGGTLTQFTGLFDALTRSGHGDVLGMTFDIGNWLWAGEVPLDAARLLAPYVEYIHCKAATGEGARRFAVAPSADDGFVTPVLASLPRDVPRGIEFPFDAARIEQDAAHYVGWLSAA
ncbi:TIM barrel protein [Paraburkholderia sp.]|uniref:sugar phosphate isomerase/epimerase family protein n=1 Tax=Paraburkholderia sp. TaxID=1926495 RepID=UPI00238C5BAC|nr:TIM barrel protein [Paraburkholderia sp.]MDE1184185.1 TIM barrel protein [Paraburkholderia sp.]